MTEEVKTIMGGGINSPAGTPLNIFGTIAHHPRLLKRFMNFAGMFLNKGLLPDREREIVILRVGWNCQSVYEFGQHTLIGQRVGLSLKEIDALTKDVEQFAWNNRDRVLINMSDELCADDCVSTPTWAQLSTQWNEAELVERAKRKQIYEAEERAARAQCKECRKPFPGIFRKKRYAVAAAWGLTRDYYCEDCFLALPKNEKLDDPEERDTSDLWG